jgi:hypothetical protein
MALPIILFLSSPRFLVFVRTTQIVQGIDLFFEGKHCIPISTLQGHCSHKSRRLWDPDCS